MKISSLYIKNFKNISLIDISDLPNFLMVVGENGIGKTSIFDAIGFVKSFIGPYASNDRHYWENKILLHNPVTVGASEMKIILEIEPTTEKEKEITGGEKAKAGIEIKINNNQPGISQINEHNASNLLSSRENRTKIGGVEIIPANRTYREGDVGLQSRKRNDEQYFQERASNLQNKFRDAKQTFVNALVHDTLRPQDPKIFPEIQSLVETLLGKKVEVGFEEDGLNPIIEIQTKNGNIDIDTLSSGQRELFMTYVGLYSAKLSNSIILFDEPDLHLHASLQKEVLKYVVKLSKEGNQIFSATHALEMISETPEENIFHLTEFNDNSQLKKLEDEKEKLGIFKKLGASKYTFVNFKKVVFLEGPSDYLIYQNSVPSDYGLRFEQIGGISKLTPEILDEASAVESFYMIQDRDFLDDNKISELETKYHNKVKFLKRRHLENYILDSDEFFEIYQKHGDGQFTSKADLINELHNISMNQKEQTIADYYLFEHSENTNPPRVSLESNQSAEDGLANILSTKKDRLETTISSISSNVSSLRSRIDEDWSNNWIVYSSGKNILSSFVSAHFASKSMEDIRDMVSIKWDERQTLPNDLDSIIKEIVNY